MTHLCRRATRALLVTDRGGGLWQVRSRTVAVPSHRAGGSGAVAGADLEPLGHDTRASRRGRGGRGGCGADGRGGGGAEDGEDARMAAAAFAVGASGAGMVNLTGGMWGRAAPQRQSPPSGGAW
jgi:hypothetical protein